MSGIAPLEKLVYNVNRKRISRLMHLMDLEAIYPKNRTSDPAKGHKKYPYLLRNLAVGFAREKRAEAYFQNIASERSI